MADPRQDLAAAQKRYNEYKLKGDSFGMEIENNNIIAAQNAIKNMANSQTPKLGTSNSTPTTNSTSNLLTILGQDMFTQAQNYVPPPASEPKTGLMWKENASQVSTPAPAPAPAPVINAQDNYMNDLKAAINKLSEQMSANNQAYNDKINNQIANINNILGPQNFSAILQQVMQSYQPIIDAIKQQSATALTEANRLTDIDAEKRGIFNSGIASTMVQKNVTDNSNALALALAELQKQAVSNTNNTVSQQLQGASLIGNMLSDSYKSSSDALKTGLESAFNLNTAYNKDRETTLAEKKIENDFTVSTWENTLAKQRMANDYDIALKNIENDKNRTAIEKQNLIIQQQKLALDNKQFDESIRQFNAEMALKKQIRIDDITKFNTQIRMQGAESKAALINANANMLRAQIDEKKYLSDAELLNYQKSMDVYNKMSDGYKFVASMKKDILDGKMPYSDAVAMIKPYEQLDKMYPGIYKEMMTTVNEYYRTKTDSDNIDLRNNRDAAKTVQPNAAPVPTGSSGLLRTPNSAPTPNVKTTPAPYPYN